MTPDASMPGAAVVSDEELVARVWAGDEGALEGILRRYRGFVRRKARSYFLVGGDPEDLCQEGMIGLYKAVRDFDAVHQSSFRAFAELCVTRQLLTAIKTATRQKHSPLNTYLSLDAPLPSDGEHGDASAAVEVIAGPAEDPAARVVSIEELAELRRVLVERLSALETDVLQRYVAGHTYQEIAADLDRHTKAIDNALQRIKRKLDGYLSERRLQEPA